MRIHVEKQKVIAKQMYTIDIYRLFSYLQGCNIGTKSSSQLAAYLFHWNRKLYLAQYTNKESKYKTELSEQ